MHINRRKFLGAAGALAAPFVLPGCGFTSSDSPSSSTGAPGTTAAGSSTAGTSAGGSATAGTAATGSSSTGVTGTLNFTTWGTDAELAGFQSVIDGFQKANAGATVALNSVPYGQMFTTIDGQLQAGNPPDVFRVPYYTFGSYAGRGQLLDLTPHLESGFSDRFTPTAWAAVQNAGKPYGVPHHTDTSAILYNKTLLDAAGITSVPTTLDTAWTWDELGEVAGKLRASLPDDKYPFAYNWQGNGITRWLSLLFQAGGAFLDTDQKTAVINSDAGRAAVDFSKSFFANNWVPQSDTPKSTVFASDLWYAETTAMVWGGAFLIPDATKNLAFEWGATFAPRKARGGSDFGGNALVATAQSANPELATAFLAYVTEQEQMRQFCASSSLLPTRQDLVKSGIDFAVRPELSPVFIGQASTVQAKDAAQVASPSMSKIITALKDQLEQAFVGGQDTDTTLANLQSGIAAATAS